MLTDMENMSNNQHLCFSYLTGRTPSDNHGDSLTTATAGRRRLGWQSAQMDADLLAAALIVAEWSGVTSPLVSPTAAEVERLITEPNPLPGWKPPVHWWNDSIAVARSECVRRR